MSEYGIPTPHLQSREALISRLTEIATLFPTSTPHDAAPLRLAIMSLVRYIDDEAITRKVLELCPSLLFEEVR